MQMRDKVLLRLPGLKPSHDPRTELEGDAQITKLYGLSEVANQRTGCDEDICPAGCLGRLR